LSMKAPKLDQIIETASGETEVHRALEWYPWVVMEVITSRQSFVVSQFSIGDQYRADFVVAEFFSGGWEIHFIELEPPAISPFKKNGELTSRLVHAAGQIRRWKEFEERHDKRPALVSQLRAAIIKKDLTWADGREPKDSAGKDIMWPESLLLMNYHVVMGRRSQLNSELMLRKARLIKSDGYELITYDRVIDVFNKQRHKDTYHGTVRKPGTRARRRPGT
jgi:Shedu protein SduA, C-terminal